MPRKTFNRKAPRLSEAEQALKEWGIEYTKRKNGSIFVPGDLNISRKNLTRLPDLSRVIVGGEFTCSQNELTSLMGAPQTVGGDFSCGYNQLASLEGAPRKTGGSFYCHANKLTSLEAAPVTIKGEFYCLQNELTTLEGIPENFTKLTCDFGKFLSWGDVPKELRASEETIVRRAYAATILQDNLQIRRPLKLNRKAVHRR